MDDLFCQIKRELGGTYKQGVSEVRDENLKLEEVNYYFIVTDKVSVSKS